MIIRKKIFHIVLFTLMVTWVLLTITRHVVTDKTAVTENINVEPMKDETAQEKVDKLHLLLKTEGINNYQLIHKSRDKNIILKIQNVDFSAINNIIRDINKNNEIVIQCDFSSNDSQGLINVNSLTIKYL